jgi:hypothetical protein
MIKFKWQCANLALIKQWIPSVVARVALFGLVISYIGSCYALGEEVDRLVAAVNGTIITEGDLDLARGLNALIFPGKRIEPDSRDEEINRLIDLELMRQELKNFSLGQEDESKVEARVQALRAAHDEAGGLHAFLQKLGLQESELISYLKLELSILRFVDFRFRPFANVTAEEIKTYFENRLVPQLQKSKLEVPPLAQVSSRIEEILKEEKINAVLEQWIQDIRRNSRIEYFNNERLPNGPKAQKFKDSNNSLRSGGVE